MSDDTPTPPEKANDEQQPRFMTVEECRATLPIKISRREVVRYIKAAGPGYYQEHRRQLFLTPEQWSGVVATMKPPGTRVVRRGPEVSPGAERAFRRAQKLLAKSKMARRS